MELTRKRQELFFWVLQVFGWFSSSVLIFVLIDELSKTIIIYDYIVGSLIGILATSIYRIFLKNNIDVELFGKGSIKRLVFAFIAVSCFYYCLDFFASWFYDLIWVKTDAEIERFEEARGLVKGLLDCMFSIFIWTFIYFIIKFILNANQNKLRSIELNTILKEAQLNTLKGQVNPHFMFNSLNNIRGLMLEDVDKSRDMITKLSEMLEYALEKNTVDAISVSEELEMVENYIALSKIQMEDRLQFVKDIDAETLSLSIPPMIIQLLIENAAKHGIANLKNGGTIRLIIEKLANDIRITVTNTGRLRITENSTQLGLKNIRQRLRLLYDSKASFSLEEVDDEVVAKIKIPFV